MSIPLSLLSKEIHVRIMARVKEVASRTGTLDKMPCESILSPGDLPEWTVAEDAVAGPRTAALLLKHDVSFLKFPGKFFCLQRG